LGTPKRKRSTARAQYVADFETTTDENDCRVWGWGLANINTADSVWDVEMSNNMADFIDRISCEPSVCYFHNLRFDGHFIMDWLFRHGDFVHVDDNPGKGQFSTIISNMAQFYSITVTWCNGVRTEFRDSLKKLPLRVAEIAEAFNQPELKGSIDYHSYRPVGHQLTLEERTYLAHDVMIVARALKTEMAAGMTKLTVGSDSLADFKKILGAKVFEKMFPILPETMDAEIRRAYRGGFTYVAKRFQAKRLGAGRVYDVNSLYPSVMYHKPMPYGLPVFAPGLPKASKSHPLFTVTITFTAKLKKDHIPCIQVKGSSHFLATEYQTHIKEPTTITCTNIDLALWEEHYDMDILSYEGGWLFQSVDGVFNDYIDKWMEVKTKNRGGIRFIAKLHLNSLYGKFGTNPNITPKVPVFEDNVVKLVLGDPDTREPIYTAMSVFIAAYARDVTIRAAQQHYDVFAYADTDSLHLLVDCDPETLDVDPDKLGAWKREYIFSEALFMRAKTYTELVDGKHETHIAGLPVEIAAQLTFDDFSGGRTLVGKKTPKRVPGGIVLQDVDFTMPAL